MDQTSSTGFFKQNKGLELGFMILGLALFIALGARGLQRIGDMRVAAGERNKLMTAQTDSELQNARLPDGSILLSSITPQPAQAREDTTKNTRNNENRQSSQEAKTKTEPNESQVEALVRNVKRQNI